MNPETPRYRLVHFSPHPMLEWAVPVAALVRDADGRVKTVRTLHLPGAQCLGSATRAVLLRSTLPLLAAHGDFETLPFSLGPHFRLSEQVYPLPVNIANPEQWIQKLLYQGSGQDRVERGMQRSTEGMLFFKTWGVDNLVSKRFTVQGKKTVSDTYGLLKPITHYVGNERELLLMEPLSVTKLDWETDARTIVTSFLAYKQALSTVEHGWESVSYVSYVLPGGTADDRRHSMQRLEGCADLVVDGANHFAAASLAEQIRETAQPGLN